MGVICACGDTILPNNQQLINTEPALWSRKRQINRIINYETGEREIHIAVKSSNVKYIKYLSDNGCNINSKTLKTKDTPLHIAALRNSVTMIDLLLSLNANTNIKNANGLLAFDLCNDSLKGRYCNYSHGYTTSNIDNKNDTSNFVLFNSKQTITK